MCFYPLKCQRNGGVFGWLGREDCSSLLCTPSPTFKTHESRNRRGKNASCSPLKSLLLSQRDLWQGFNAEVIWPFSKAQLFLRSLERKVPQVRGMNHSAQFWWVISGVTEPCSEEEGRGRQICRRKKTGLSGLGGETSTSLKLRHFEPNWVQMLRTPTGYRLGNSPSRKQKARGRLIKYWAESRVGRVSRGTPGSSRLW